MKCIEEKKKRRREEKPLGTTKGECMDDETTNSGTDSRTPMPQDAEYWDTASKYWKDVVTVNPRWAWNTFYCKNIPDDPVNILVVGVTDGAFLKLIRKFRPKAWVCGVDLSFSMLVLAQKIEKKVVCCRGSHLPFKSETFDIVLSDYFLSVIQKDVLEGTVEEIERVLTHDGVLLAKELRHQGHMAVWAVLSFLTGLMALASLVLIPVLALFTFPLCGLMLFMYNPLTRTMGRSAPILKFSLHLSRLIIKRKRFPTVTEIKDLYYLSKKYLNIFTDKEINYLFLNSSLIIDPGITLLSWNFSLTGVKTAPRIKDERENERENK